MKLIVTGGGTGGHIYPALEVARYAKSQGAEISYFGSFRGQEGRACDERGIQFRGFPSEPLYSLKSPRGWKAFAKLLKARGMAKTSLRQVGPDAVFSTGGYSAGPVVAAARALGIPYFIHEANSVPGRANLMFAKQARAFTTVFKATERFAPGVQCQRVGQPIRRELRDAVARRSPESDFVFGLGGSQGSEFLNGCVPRAFSGETLSTARLLLASGPKNYDDTQRMVEALSLTDRIQVAPYLDTSQMLDAYSHATMVIGRSGGTLAELAMFGLPSVLVPLPSAAGNHQFHNAEEFVQMTAATLIPQFDATPSAVAEAVAGWLYDPARQETARAALQAWDLPNATESIWNLISGVRK